MGRVSKFYDSITDRIAAPSRRTNVEFSRNARIDRVPGGIRIVILGWFGWGSIVFHVAWLYFALSMSGNKLLPILHGKVDWGTVASLIFWNAHSLIALASLLWQVAGREVISIDGVLMTQRIELLGVGWTRRFMLADVRGLYAFSVLRPDANTAWRPDMLRNCITFSCAQKTYRLGRALNYEAALRVARAIREAYPSVSRTA